MTHSKTFHCFPAMSSGDKRVDRPETSHMTPMQTSPKVDAFLPLVPMLYIVYLSREEDHNSRSASSWEVPTKGLNWSSVESVSEKMGLWECLSFCNYFVYNSKEAASYTANLSLWLSLISQWTASLHYTGPALAYSHTLIHVPLELKPNACKPFRPRTFPCQKRDNVYTLLGRIAKLFLDKSKM